MQVGDIVILRNEWVELNPWMQEMFAEWGEAGIGLIVKDYGPNNHHVVVLVGNEELRMSKTKLELLCK